MKELIIMKNAASSEAAPYSSLFGDFCCACLADHSHPDLTGVLHGLFDLLGNVTGQPGRSEIVDRIGLDDDPNFAPRLDGEGLLYTLKGHGHLLEGTDALDIGFEVLAARTRART